MTIEMTKEPNADNPTVAADAAAPSTGMERAFSSSAMGRRDEMALLNRHAETPRLLALLGLPLIDGISLYDVRIRLENALSAAEAEAAEDTYVAQRMTETLAEIAEIIIGEDARPEDETLNAIERVKKAAQVLRLEVDLYRAQREEAAAQPDERAAFEWPPLPDFPESFAHVAGHAYFTEHQMQGYANAYGEMVRATAPQSTKGDAAAPSVLGYVPTDGPIVAWQVALQNALVREYDRCAEIHRASGVWDSNYMKIIGDHIARFPMLHATPSTAQQGDKQ